MSLSNSPEFESQDDVWLAARALDEACQRQMPYSGDNPLPYSIVSTDVYPEANVGIYWPARPMVWEIYGLDMATADLKCADWSINQIYERYVLPLENTLGTGNGLVNTLILVEAAGEAFERFLNDSDYLVRWQPVIRPEEWDRVGVAKSVTDISNIANYRLFASPADAAALSKPGQLTWMRKALEGFLKHYSSQFLTGELRWQGAHTAYPKLSGQSDDTIFGLNEGLITDSLTSPRQSIWVGDL